MRVLRVFNRFSDIDALQRTAIVLGRISAGASALLFVIWAALSRDAFMLVNSIGPAILALLCHIMLRTHWYRTELILSLAALSTVVSFRLAGQDGTATPAAIALVVIVSVGALFVEDRWRIWYISLGSAGLLLTGPFWHGLNTDGVWVGISAAASGTVAMVLFISVRDAAVASDRRYRLLVEKLPVPLIEQDWSEIRAWLDELRAAGVTDLDAYFEKHPDQLHLALDIAHVRAVNPAIQDMFGEESASDPDDEGLFGVDTSFIVPYMRNELLQMWKGTTPAASDHRVIRADGTEMWARVEAADIEPGAIPGVDRVAVATDVTELRATQERLAELVRSKDEFIAAVSHELRTPLTSVMGFSELLTADTEDMSAHQLEMLQLVKSQAQDMAHIVEDLLVAARAEMGTIIIDSGPVDIADVASEVASNLGIIFEFNGFARPVVHADRVRVGQILRNLLTNATRYGGPWRSIHVLDEPGLGVVEVRDNGEGIAPEHRERIFEPYTTVHNRPGMTTSVGLGLAVSQQLADLMGGSIDYRREGLESVFRLRLPLSEAAVEAQPAQVAPTQR